MRNIFKRNKKTDLIEDVLDTDEGKITKQYRVYLNYLQTVKKELLRRGAEFVGYNKRTNMATGNR